MGGLCALPPLHYSPGHGITIAACAPMLGFTQPNSRVGRGTPFFGTPFRPSYVCPTCGALVATSAEERHVDWHVKIGG